MNLLFKQILENKEAAALPGLLESGRLPALVSGLSAVHRANLCAAVFSELERPVFVICPDDTAAENFAADLKVMTGESPAVIGMRDYAFYAAEAVSRGAEQKRLKAMHAMAEGKTKICVASATGLIQRSIPPESLTSAAFSIDYSKRFEVEELEEKLFSCGYVKSDRVEGPGQFARRGGILDFYSPDEKQPVRVELFDDEIESIKYFDVSDQRCTEMIDSCTILPAAESLPALAPGGSLKLSEEIEAFAKKYASRRNSDHAARLSQNMLHDAERIRETVNISDADRYLPVIYRESFGTDYIPEDAFVFIDRANRCEEKIKDYAKQLGDDIRQLSSRGETAMSADAYYMTADRLFKTLADYPVYMADDFTVGRHPIQPAFLTSIPAKQLPSYSGSAQAAAEDAALYIKQGYSTVILAADERRAKVLQEFFSSHSIDAIIYKELTRLPEKGSCCITVGSVSAGIEYPGIKLAILTDVQLLRQKDKKKQTKKKLPPGRAAIESCADLSPGDYIVHENHGIGKFSGIVKMVNDGMEKDYIKIAYAGADVLYVPATQLDMVSKYTGGGEERVVRLSKMGGTEWAKTRSRAKGSAKEMAEKLIALYAERQRLPGHAFAPDSPWQTEFEENFEYTETDDQLRCIAEIKKDMESSVPMDRLLCGDVGFGKTEVALRAVMKCVLDGKQAAILVPTTVLARQHYQTALQRFFGFPVQIETLSRLKTEGQSNNVIRDIATGKCDLVIGTHRLLSKDIHFRNLGLLVVDEEQRFGVTHKEHIKEMSKGVDVLTLSATPIPRTLNMAMSGIRDMSNIEEPPEDRLPVQTFVIEHDWGIVADAIRRELQRGGQVYYLHNRIDDIEKTARRLSDMLEDATVAVAHGKMEKNMLANVMESVSNGEIQVLVCTTIIETGIDIPNVNTLIIEDADRLGLAQLHQIRGRVGRSTRKASAYLTFRRDKVLSEDAEKRLTAIRDFAQFGSGIKIAMRDLEIRGAGNLLGAEQSGHMIDVGYDMYMKLLNEAVLEARGIELPKRAECSADLAVAANIPERYIESPEQRMDIYRRIAVIRNEEDADDLIDELIDRFGEPPPGVNALIQIALLRGVAGNAGIVDISQKQGYIIFVFKEFDFEKVSLLYSKPEYKNRLKVEAGSKPAVSLKILSKTHVIEEARRFAVDWQSTTKDNNKEEGK